MSQKSGSMGSYLLKIQILLQLLKLMALELETCVFAETFEHFCNVSELILLHTEMISFFSIMPMKPDFWDILYCIIYNIKRQHLCHMQCLHLKTTLLPISSIHDTSQAL